MTRHSKSRFASMSLLIVLIALSAMAIEISAAQTSEPDEDIMARLQKGIEAVVTFKYGDQGNALINDLETIIYQLPPNSQLRPVIEKKLLETLDRATPDGRAVICNQLYVIGSDQCVPALEHWLADPETGRFALYALGRNESPLVNDALQRTLSRVEGLSKVAIVDALGKRRAQGATADIARLINSDDQLVELAAVRAFGDLGSQDAVVALQSMRDLKTAVRVEVDNSLLQCAESLAKDGRTASAADIYADFFQQQTSPELRRAGLRGLLLVQPLKTLPVLVGLIKNDDAHLGRFAISLLSETSSSEVQKTIASLLGQVPDETKILLLRAIAERRDATVQNAVLDCLANSSHAAVRLAALETLGQVGTGESVPSLLESCASGADSEKAIAVTSIVGLPGDDVDEQLCQAFSNTTAVAPIRVAAVEALSLRDARDATGQLVGFVRDEDDAVRTAVIEALGSLVKESEIVILLKQLSDPVKSGDAKAIAAACRRALLRLGNEESSGRLVLDALKSSPAKARTALLPLLTVSGSNKALLAVVAAEQDGDKQLQLAAIRTMADWPNAAPIEAVVKIFQNAKSDEAKQAALKGCIRLASLSDDPAAVYRRILKEVNAVSDQKDVLVGMGESCDSPEMLDLAMAYMSKDAALRPNAGLAAVHIANRVRTKDESLARESLQRVIDEVRHEDVEQRARNVLNEMDKYQGHIFEWLIAGPYKEEGKEGEEIYGSPFGPESDDADDVQWKPIRRGQKTWSIDLEQALGANDYCAAYLRTFVWSDKDQDAIFEAGADDAIKVWVNGQLCYEQWRTGGPVVRSMVAEFRLKRGWNALLVKVVDHGGGWEFGGRVRGPGGVELKGLKYEKTPPK